jgi:hypothetical protein
MVNIYIFFFEFYIANIQPLQSRPFDTGRKCNCDWSSLGSNLVYLGVAGLVFLKDIVVEKSDFQLFAGLIVVGVLNQGEFTGTPPAPPIHPI